MPYHKLSTAKIAKDVGCHPNTVRLYEQWGFLPPVPRSRSGYRLYTNEHLDQMRLARLALNSAYPGRNIRRSASELILKAASGDLGGALERAYHHLGLVRTELVQAEAAASLLERWAQGIPADSTAQRLHISQAAKLLGLTPDILRNWEANGLLQVPRNPDNGYRLYGPPELARLRIIRMLRNSGYSPMSILRMLTQLDDNLTQDVRHALDTPRPDEDLYSASDRWLSTLRDQEERAQRIITHLEERIQTQLKK